VEGPHRESSLSATDTEARFRRFMACFLDLAAGGPAPLWVREHESLKRAILDEPTETATGTQETTPFAIVSVDWKGNVSTFSPELLGLADERYGDFMLGNVRTDSLDAMLTSPRFGALRHDIEAGIAQCRHDCAYFQFCGGGAPVNKLSENGSFVSTETLFCRLNRQAMLDVVLDRLRPSRREGTWRPA